MANPDVCTSFSASRDRPCQPPSNRSSGTCTGNRQVPLCPSKECTSHVCRDRWPWSWTEETSVCKNQKLLNVTCWLAQLNSSVFMYRYMVLNNYEWLLYDLVDPWRMPGLVSCASAWWSREAYGFEGGKSRRYAQPRGVYGLGGFGMPMGLVGAVGYGQGLGWCRTGEWL